MFYSTVLLAAAGLAGLASAQNYTTSGPLNITASQIDSSLRQSWCRAETNSCPQICGGQAFPNSCDPNSLSYVCNCTNGLQPNISDYQQTIPFFLCEQWIANCVKNHPDDLTGITACQSVVCGQKNATTGEAGSNSSSSGSGAGSGSGTASPSASGTGSAGAGGSSASASGGSSTASSTAAAASASKSSAAMAMSVAKDYGTGILVTGLLAIFGLAL